jgi:uncharacterized protein YqgC (DUF456 family)
VETVSVLLWTAIILLFILSIAGIFMPILPSVLFLWGGFLIYHFLIDSTGLGSVFWWGMGILTAIMFIVDYVASAYFVKKYGGSKWSMLGSILGMILFPFIMGPLGIIIGPFIAIFVIEMLLGQTKSHSFKVAWGSFISFISSSFVKVLVTIGMIIWFFIDI